MTRNMSTDIFRSHISSTSHESVECLGMTFPNDMARRAHFTEKLRDKLKDPAFRKTEGFPIAEDQDILALSDPPYYTACPNPWLHDLMGESRASSGSENAYHVEPYASDVSEGKQDPICMAHTYHTKVPYRAIARYILHYTRPGDLVLDSFAGTGMTGVAAQLCATADSGFRSKVEEEFQRLGLPSPKWGGRRVILNDLSPFATFLCRCFNSALSANVFIAEAKALIAESRKANSWMYETDVPGSAKKTEMGYTLWSESFFCECGEEIVLWHPTDPKKIVFEVSTAFSCPKCRAQLAKTSCEQVTTTFRDPLLKATITQNKYTPSIISFSTGSQTQFKLPSPFDLALLSRIAAVQPSSFVPVTPMMFKGTAWGDKYRAGCHVGISHAHHFWTHRNLLVLSDLFSRAFASAHKHEMLFVCTSFAVKTGSRMHNVGFKNGRINLAGQGYNALQLQGISAERNLFTLADGKADDLACVFEQQKRLDSTCITTGSATSLSGVVDNSVDYVFIDPPFGDNIAYSELSFLYECWLRVFSQQEAEAVVSSAQGKTLQTYHGLMLRAFQELHRVLKPGRWITVAFHNSKNAVWNVIQEALGVAGFVVADVRILDKGQGTYNQMTTQGAVEKDLAISAYKPHDKMEEAFTLVAGTEKGAWEFARNHLRQLPSCVTKDAVLETVAERQQQLLFDRMVAFHVQRGVTVPLSASEFYAGLRQRFPERDGMYFLPEQVAEYDRRRLSATKVEQLTLFVSDEKSAIQWVRQRVTQQPMTYKELQPLFMQEAQRVWERHEQPIELMTILEQGFVVDDDGKWHVADPKKDSDLEQVRGRALLREFERYRESKGKIRVVRTEALRAGFKECWQKQDYATIVQMAKRVPDSVIQEDQALLMYYDNALMRTGE